MSSSSQSLAATTHPPRVFSLSRLAWVAPAAGAVAGVLNLGVYAIASAAGVDFLAQPPGAPGLEPIPAVMPLVSSIVYAAFAGIVLALINRFSEKPQARFLWIAVPIGFALSFVPVLAMPSAVAVSTKVALGIMHVVAAPIVAGGLVWLGKRRR